MLNKQYSPIPLLDTIDNIDSFHQIKNHIFDAMSEATVHWLRHTGISDDVKRRARTSSL